ncbi:MAG: DUF6712 family protein [Bacteroidales bacterium]
MILKTLIDFNNVVPTTAGTENFSDFEPYVRSAEIWLKTNILGKTLYDAINAEEYDDDDLIRLCQNVIGNHAYWDAIPFLDVIQTDSGFAVISATGKVPASKERVERLREQCLTRRDNEVDFLIAYLEENANYHDAWKGSPAYSVMTDTLIRTATELKLFSQWDGTRREFLQLRPKMIRDTMTKLNPIFSKNYIEELIELQRDGNIEGENLYVIEMLKYAIGAMINGSIEIAEQIVSDALYYIDSNIDQFTTYTDSAEYKVRLAAGYENSTDSTIFSSIYL